MTKAQDGDPIQEVDEPTPRPERDGTANQSRDERDTARADGEPPETERVDSGRLPSTDDGYDRDESEGERLDRNWNDILQELRVLQTGVQLITGFLLTIPFQARFDTRTTGQRTLFLVLVVLAALATITILATVHLHRVLFAKRVKDVLVHNAHRMLRAAIILVGVILIGVCVLIFDVVLGDWPALWIGIGLGVIIMFAWFAFPALARRTNERS